MQVHVANSWVMVYGSDFKVIRKHGLEDNWNGLTYLDVKISV